MASPGGILALDLSSITGWAVGPRRLQIGDKPIAGTWHLATSDAGALFASFENELEDALILHAPSILVVEAPLPLTAISNTTVWRQQLGLACLAETSAWRHSVLFREQSAGDMRRAIVGTAQRKKGMTIKDIVGTWVRAQGWHAVDNNAADALLVYEFTRRELAGRAAA